jgi:hypothetical protein
MSMFCSSLLSCLTIANVFYGLYIETNGSFDSVLKDVGRDAYAGLW